MIRAAGMPRSIATSSVAVVVISPGWRKGQGTCLAVSGNAGDRPGLESETRP